MSNGSITHKDGFVKRNSPGRTNEGTNQAEDKADGTVADKEADTEDFSDATDDAVMPDVAEESEASSGDVDFLGLLEYKVPEGYFDEDSEVEIDEKQIREEAVKDSAFIEANDETERVRREYEKARGEYLSAGGIDKRNAESYEIVLDMALGRKRGSKKDYRRLVSMAQRVDELHGELLNAQKRQDEVYEQVRQRVLSELSGGQNDGGFGGETSEQRRFAIVGKVRSESGSVYENAVLLDTDIFDKKKFGERSKALRKYVYDKLAGKKITVTDSDGNSKIIEFARANERITKDGARNPHRVIDKLATKSDRNGQLAAAHAAEIIYVSNPDTVSPENIENSHQWLDYNGWEFRTSILIAPNGNLFEATLNIAKTKDGRSILYDINKIKTIGRATLPVSELRKNAKQSGSLTIPDGENSIPHKDGFVKGEGKEKSDSGVTDSKKALACDASGDERLSFSEGNKNAAVENFATRMTGRFKASGKDIKVEVFYDGSAGALRGEWVSKGDGGAVIRLNGSLLRGSESASWVLCHELFHEGVSADGTLTMKVLYAFYKSGMYDESQFEAYREVYEEHYGENLPEEFIAQEVAADLMYKAMGSKELLEMFAAKADGNVLGRLASGVAGIAKGIGGVLDGSRARRYLGGAYSVTEVFEEAVKRKNHTSAEERYAITNVNGKKIVYIETDITKNKPEDMKYTEYIEGYIADLIADDNYISFLPENGIPVYASEDLPSEFANSTYTKYLRNRKQDRFYAKLKTAKSFDELVSIATGRRWEKAKHTHNKDAFYGVGKYSTVFAFPVYDAANRIIKVSAYTCDIVVLNASDGKKYLYDIINIKESPKLSATLTSREKKKASHVSERSLKKGGTTPAGGNPENGIRRETEKSQLGSTSEDSISQDNGIVKRKAAISGKPASDAESKQRRESPMNRAIEAGAQDLLGLAMTNEEYEEVAREVIESAEKTFGKDSPEAMLQAELTRLGRELRKVGRQIDGTMKAYKVKAFSVDEKKLDAFVERLCGVLEIDGKRSDVSSVREELYGLYILMEDYIAGSTSAEAVAAAARGISEDIIRLRKASELARLSKDVSDRSGIMPGMSDEKRQAILEEKGVEVPHYDADKLSLFVDDDGDVDFEALSAARKGEAKSILKKVAKKFGIYKEYHNTDIDISFAFSGGRLMRV